MELSDHLKTRALKSTAWFAGTRLWMQALSWGVTIVLARLLTPGDYGLFGMAMAVIAFLELFQEFGLGVAIVQKQKLNPQQLNAIFFIALAGSLVIALATSVGAGIAAVFYGEPRLAGVLRVLALSFLLNSLGMVPYNLLTKEIDFRRRSLAESAGAVVSSAVSLGLAYWGYGVWALALGYLARTAVRDVGMAVSCGWFPGLDVSFEGMREVMSFGLRIASTSVFVTLSNLANTAIVGRVLGGAALGFYSMAESLGTNPLHRLSTAVVNQLSLPVFSNLQEDVAQLRKYFLKVTRYLALASAPAQIGIALVARDLVLVLLGEKWLPMVGVLQVFSIGGVFYTTTLPAGPLLTARGRADVIFRVGAGYAVAITIGFLIGTQFGLGGVAAAWAVIFPIMRLCALLPALREIEIRFGEYISNIGTALVATGAMAVAVLAAQVFIGAQFGSMLRLLSSVLFGAVVYAAAVFALDRALAHEVRDIAREMLPFARARVASA